MNMSLGARHRSLDDLKDPAVAVLAALISVTALGGAVGLITGLLWLPEPIVQRLPFESPQFAGGALALIVGVPTATLAALAALGRPESDRAAEISGAAVIGWILIELAFIREISFLHPMYLALGLVLLLVGRRRRRAVR
jgi:hypothetical protein